jgi:hypothetical protein
MLANEIEYSCNSNQSLNNTKMIAGGNMRADSKNTTSQMNVKDTFLSSMGESSMQELEDTMKRNERSFKMTGRNINELIKQFTAKRYGVKNERMA